MVRLILRRIAGWAAMIVVATNATYFLAVAFLDPRSNYRDTRPVPSEIHIDQALAPYNLDPRVPVLERWWHWLSDIVLHFDWGRPPPVDRSTRRSGPGSSPAPNWSYWPPSCRWSSGWAWAW